MGLGLSGRAAPLSPRASWAVGLALALAWLVLIPASARVGSTGTHGWAVTFRGALAAMGLGEPLDPGLQTIVGLRLRRALAAGGVGASLALAGGYLQGLFRNGLASPSVVGVTAGSVLGASCAIALLGGLGPSFLVEGRGALGPALVTVSAFAGACAVSLFVLAVASVGGRLSVPTLLLAGIAVNTLIAGVLAALQSLTLQDYDVSRAILAWTFGTLDDRSGWQVALVWAALALAAGAIPFVAAPLDLFAGGEEDARSLGVPVQALKVAVLLAAALATAASVSVAGQIAFVGLVVPHLVRILGGASHRSLLPLSLLSGGVFLLGCDLAQRVWLGGVELRPGILMSLVGGPFFLVLLFRNKRILGAW